MREKSINQQIDEETENYILYTVNQINKHNDLIGQKYDTPNPNLDSILLEAEGIVNGNRRAEYPDPVVNFEMIGKFSSMLTGKDLTAADCCKVMLAVKLSREAYCTKRDNLVDLCGYAEILNRIENQNKK